MQTTELKESMWKSNDSIIRAALVGNEYDTLRAIAALIQIVTNSELLSVKDVYNEGTVKGLEVMLEHKGLAVTGSFTFIRYYWLNGKFILFTVSGHQSDIDRLLLYKNVFFQSIHFF